MFCKKCGKELTEDEKFCRNCGTPVENSNTINESATEDIQNNNLNNSTANYSIQNDFTNNKRKVRKSIIIGIVVFIIFVVSIAASLQQATELEAQKETEKRQMIEKYVSSYDKLDKIIKSCGFSEYDLEYVGKEKGTDYFIIREKNSNISGGLNIKNKKVTSIDYAGSILYKDGKKKHTLSDFIITSSEKADYIETTKNTINSVLKSPSTAKYPWDYDEWAIAKDGKKGIVIVQGYVDAQNSFGATTRSQFQVKYKNNKVTSLIFDGEEYM